MKSIIAIPLVNWGMGAVIIGVFALVCITMSIVIYRMINTDKENSNTDDAS